MKTVDSEDVTKLLFQLLRRAWAKAWLKSTDY